MKKINKFRKIIALMVSFALSFLLASNLLSVDAYAAGNLPARICIDYPISNSNQSNFVDIGGWALDSSGMKEVNIYVDNTFSGQAILGIQRPDVNNVFPGYTGGLTSGYYYKLDISNVSKGNHTIKVEAVGNSGYKNISTKNIIKGGLQSITCLDFPINGKKFAQEDIYIRGWALNESGIKEIKVYVDGEYRLTATKGLYRPDVGQVYKEYKTGANSGFETSLKFDSISTGPHNVIIEAIGNDGTIGKASSSFTIEKKPNITVMDFPAEGKTYGNEGIFVGGWSLSPSGVNEIKVYVDGEYKGNAIKGIQRPDVNSLFPGYIDGNIPGYQFSIEGRFLSPGKHTVKVESIGKDGSVNSSTKTINIGRKPPILNLDYPSSQQIFNNNGIFVGGWALNDSGLKEIQIWVDDKQIGSTEATINRPDVNGIYKGYFDAGKFGFGFSFDSKNISPGSHKVVVKALGYDGTVQSNSRAINIIRKQPILCLDFPKEQENFNNRDIYLRGWTLNDSGIKNIKVYVDDKYLGDSAITHKRPDVNSIFPGYYNGEDCGFDYLINADTIKPGYRKITVEVIGNDSTTVRATRTVEVTKLPEIVNIDKPITDKTYSTNDVVLSGWALNASRVKEIKVFIDNEYVGNASTGVYRPDVNAAYPGYSSKDYSGYYMTLPKDKLTIGEHKLKVQAIGNDGSEKLSEVPFVMYGYVNYVSYPNVFSYYVDKQFTQGVNYNWKGQQETYERVSYYMNPQNFIGDGDGKYMFLKLKYFDGISVDDLNKILAGKGVLESKGSAFLAAGKASNVNPIYLLSHSLLETGNGTSNLAKGILVSSVDGLPVTPRITYNMFGIGAVDGQAEKAGSEYAYKQGWFTIDDAITGGAQWIGNGYINSAKYQQDTLYKMKWNFDVIWHEYATDIEWAYKQTSRIRKLIEQLENSKLYFEVPIFKN